MILLTLLAAALALAFLAGTFLAMWPIYRWAADAVHGPTRAALEVGEDPGKPAEPPATSAAWRRSAR